ncbi:hypothetical protein Acsp05_36480 [Actinokineospora sp. NBRC 105648]|nr:hypothetical protein Acsp05_36480 [Actinokineospora sp. NBRC 105648]
MLLTPLRTALDWALRRRHPPDLRTHMHNETPRPKPQTPVFQSTAVAEVAPPEVETIPVQRTAIAIPVFSAPQG